MGTFASAKRTRHVTSFPDDLVHTIFSKLKFEDKLNAGLACKEWNQLLKSTPAARHWDIDYSVKRIVASTDHEKPNNFTRDKLSATVGRSAHCAYP
jgi:hypothetical protein